MNTFWPTTIGLELPAPVERDLPLHVFGLRPGERADFSSACPVPSGPAPLQPVVGREWPCSTNRSNTEKEAGDHSMILTYYRIGAGSSNRASSTLAIRAADSCRWARL